MSDILVNKIRCPDGVIIASRNRHDFVCHTTKEGKQVCIDGGTEYQRLVGDFEGCEDLSCYVGDPHEKIREYFDWTTLDEKGDQPAKHVLLKDLTTEHIKAILETQKNIKGVIKQVFIDELNYRGNNETCPNG